MSVTETSLPELKNLLIFSVKTDMAKLELSWVSKEMIRWLSCTCVCQSSSKISLLFVLVLWFCGFASHAWLTPEYVWNFNACSTQNVEPAGRDYFPLPDLSRKIERDSAPRVRFCIHPQFHPQWEVRFRTKLGSPITIIELFTLVVFILKVQFCIDLVTLNFHRTWLKRRYADSHACRFRTIFGLKAMYHSTCHEVFSSLPSLDL